MIVTFLSDTLVLACDNAGTAVYLPVMDEQAAADLPSLNEDILRRYAPELLDDEESDQ